MEETDSMKKNLSNTWSWDEKESYGFNVIAKLEETLIALDFIYDYSDIDVTENFDEKYTAKRVFPTERKSDEYRIPKEIREQDRKFDLSDIRSRTNPEGITFSNKPYGRS